MNQEQWYYFTFGRGHKGGISSYCKFFGTYSSARQQMVDHHGDKWAFQYSSPDLAGVDKYNLKEVVNDCR